MHNLCFSDLERTGSGTSKIKPGHNNSKSHLESRSQFLATAQISDESLNKGLKGLETKSCIFQIPEGSVSFVLSKQLVKTKGTFLKYQFYEVEIEFVDFLFLVDL